MVNLPTVIAFLAMLITLHPIAADVLAVCGCIVSLNDTSLLPCGSNKGLFRGFEGVLIGHVGLHCVSGAALTTNPNLFRD